MQRLMTVLKSRRPAGVRWTTRAVILAIGFAAIPRTGLDSLMHFGGLPTAPRTIAAVEPGLFEFSSMRPPAPPVPEKVVEVSAPAPLARPPVAKKVEDRKVGDTQAQKLAVARFDQCLPDCESRDPALRITASLPAGAPIDIAPGRPVRTSLIPPLPIGPGAPTGPGLAERALDSAQALIVGTGSAIAGTTSAVTNTFKDLLVL
ncbi:MAG: hypothetical protein B7Z15_05855 [Rhizobiales bacterium 32-66-8]|nr:MAG: hypothetical protein B7Z15_05855 [Rhizobiales bacterium 32-66-8]